MSAHTPGSCFPKFCGSPRCMSEGMRAIDPKGFDEAAASVRRRMRHPSVQSALLLAALRGER